MSTGLAPGTALAPQATDLLEAAGIDKEPRKPDRPSDHTPIWVRLAA